MNALTSLATRTAISVTGLRKAYGEKVVLDGVDLTIGEGEVFALDGDMRDAEHRRSSLPRIAYMPQGLGRNLYPTLTVFENLDFFGRLFGQAKGEREQRITGLLAATGLDPFPDRPAGKLSGGMKQKLSLCCSLFTIRTS